MKEETPGWQLILYIAGNTPKSVRAISNIEKLAEKYLPGNCTIEIIDLLQNPHLAETDQILAVPTLVRRYPGPAHKIIGDLSNEEKVITGLNLNNI